MCFWCSWQEGATDRSGNLRCQDYTLYTKRNHAIATVNHGGYAVWITSNTHARPYLGMCKKDITQVARIPGHRKCIGKCWHVKALQHSESAKMLKRTIFEIEEG